MPAAAESTAKFPMFAYRRKRCLRNQDADGKAYLAPVIDDVVKEINVNDGYVLIVPMKGIFDDED